MRPIGDFQLELVSFGGPDRWHSIRIIKWLGITNKRGIPTYYELLGIEPGENELM